jgi:hypothetical protein
MSDAADEYVPANEAEAEARLRRCERQKLFAFSPVDQYGPVVKLEAEQMAVFLRTRSMDGSPSVEKRLDLPHGEYGIFELSLERILPPELADDVG